MKVFDFNIHLPFVLNEDVNLVISQDMELDVTGIIEGFEFHKETIEKCDGANLLLFNTSLFVEDVKPFLNSVNTKFSDIKYTALINFRDLNIFDYIDNLVSCGVNAIMFNSYLQKISDSDFNTILRICEYASFKGLIICIDGSYGTSKMYTYDNLRLVCFLSDKITTTPIIIVHAGGARIIEAMLLAADKKNVWLDTSFSLVYYKESSIEQDFAYVIKKMNSRKVIFGSDNPYIRFDEALDTHLMFFEKFNFTKTEIENILYNNSIELFAI